MVETTCEKSFLQLMPSRSAGRCVGTAFHFPLLTNVHTDFNRRAAPFACGRAVDHDARRPKTVGHAPTRPTATALPPVVVVAFAAAAVGAVATAVGFEMIYGKEAEEALALRKCCYCFLHSVLSS